ncbi:Oxysterol-binding protein- protein 11 [Bulinus truncatus]|nr:Oxysterol-binding protein- protein 11 [Bulinus truncatus]
MKRNSTGNRLMQYLVFNKMIATNDNDDLTFPVPDLSGLSETERLQVIAVMQRAKEFDAIEEAKLQKVTKPTQLTPRAPMEGQILKFTNVVKGFQYRWFVLNPDSGTLEYFEKEEHKKFKARGSIHLAAAVVSPSEEDSQTFIISAASGELFKLRAADAKERQLWVDRIRSTAEYHTANMAQAQNVSLENVPAHISTVLSPPQTQPVSQRPSYVPQQPTSHKDSFKKSKGSHENLHVIKRHGRDETLIEVKDYLLEAEDYARNLEDKIVVSTLLGIHEITLTLK